VVYRERVVLTDLESDHFSGQLVERVGWAVLDADEIEHKDDSFGPELPPPTAAAKLTESRSEHIVAGPRDTSLAPGASTVR